MPVRETISSIVEDKATAWIGESAMQADSSSQFISCTAFANYGDGITAGVASLILGSIVTNNELDGIHAASDWSILKCAAYGNIGNGIQVDENSTVRHCSSALNRDSGIRLTGQSGVVINNAVHENDLHGIICAKTTLTAIRVDGNTNTDNDVTGLLMESGGGLVIRNVAAGNVTAFTLHADTNRGPVVDVEGVGDISTVTNANHPLANFIY